MRYFIKSILIAIFLTITAFPVSLFASDTFDNKYGFYIRLQNDIWNNIFDFNDSAPPGDYNFFRLKLSFWDEIDYLDKYRLFFKISSEPKYVIESGYPTNDPTGFDEDEVFVENLYLEVKDVFNLPIDLRLGRQDLIYGEGFLILEGTTMDAYRSTYFNAAKATVTYHNNQCLDLVYITNHKTDSYLPAWYSSEKRLLIPNDELAFILYGKNKLSDHVLIEPYYIFKKEYDTPTKINLDLNTLGIRSVFSKDVWKFRFEYTYQFGEYDDGRKRTGHGGYFFLDRHFNGLCFKPLFTIGYIYLSGDDPDTSKDEKWNNLFAGWPWLSNAYIYVIGGEHGIAYLTNLNGLKTGLNVSLTSKIHLKFSYNYLRANEDPTSRASYLSHSSKDRGHLYQIRLIYTFTKCLKGAIYFEHMIPGKFYAHDDSAHFIRTQIEYEF